MDPLRIIIQGMVFLLFGKAIDLVASRSGNHGLQLVAEAIRWGSYVPFAIAASSALHRHKTAILVVTGLALLLGDPTSLQELSTQLTTIGTGVLIGSATRALIDPEKKNGTT